METLCKDGDRSGKIGWALSALLEVQAKQRKESERRMTILSGKTLSELKRAEKSLTKELEDLKRRPPRTVQQVLSELTAMRTLIAAMTPREEPAKTFADVPVGKRQKTGPVAEKMRDILKKAGKAIHVEELQSLLATDGTSVTASRLYNILIRYEKKGWFKKDAPGRYTAS